MRWPAMVAIAVIAVTGLHDPTLAAAKEVSIKRRFGGDIVKHVSEAPAMM
jgi:hypothetical protein